MPLTNPVALGSSPNSSLPQFPQLYNGGKDSFEDHMTWYMIKHLAQGLAHSELRKHSGTALRCQRGPPPEGQEVQGLESRQLLPWELGGAGFCSFSAV